LSGSSSTQTSTSTQIKKKIVLHSQEKK
jgi:hypothetical protein